MRIFYTDESPIETLLQIAAMGREGICSGDIISKESAAALRTVGLVHYYCDGGRGVWYITSYGKKVVSVLKLSLLANSEEEKIAESEQPPRLIDDPVVAVLDDDSHMILAGRRAYRALKTLSYGDHVGLAEGSYMSPEFFQVPVYRMDDMDDDFYREIRGGQQVGAGRLYG